MVFPSPQDCLNLKAQQATDIIGDTMKFCTLLPPALVLALLTGCVTAPQITKLPGDVYSISRTDKGGSLSEAGSTKTEMMREANEFAAKQGKVPSTVLMKETPTAVQGFTAIEYQFKLVDKDAVPKPVMLSASTNTSAAPAASTAAITAPNPASPLTKAQGPHSIDIYNELIKLDELRKRGILTDDEFAREKKKVLDSN